jgi:pyruvate/2-oxoglutarate dehydrogenase complex dihydrolipoamide acyltransferase (E2) component
MSKQRTQSITVPIMGEGIRNAKIVSLLKKPGDPIALDDDLCEVETDKAVYPIQSSFAGVMGEWKTKVADIVEIGQELGTIFTDEASFADQLQTTAKASADGNAVEAAASAADDRSQHARRRGIEPALSSTITHKLSHVIPANLQIDARWDSIGRRETRRNRKMESTRPRSL